MKIGFIGLGLIGGSIAKAVRNKYPDATIVAYNRSRDPLIQAFKDGVIDAATFEIDETFRDCDYIFLCTPVQTNISFIPKLIPYLSDKTVLTDVGSTKQSIQEAVAKAIPGAHFIGGHPMAGKEKSTYSNSSRELLEGCYYIVSPSKNVNDSEIRGFEKLIESIGCNPVTIDVSTHDYIVGAISHIPHIAAYTLVKLVKDNDTPEELMKEAAAGGFKDITRVASSDPTMWEEICLDNKNNLTELLDKYIEKLEEIKELISKGDGSALHKLFEEARDYRNSMIS